jgi:glycosyltransferase involved in cell wall biosynthesis
MDVSVIIPTLNEEAHIEGLIKKIMTTNDCDVEVFVCDAGSTDNTLFKVEQLGYKNVHLVNNPRKYVSYAFNDTFLKTKGKYIALLGAHADYPEHYFDSAIKYLESECDVVGGPLNQLGKGDNGKAIAVAMSHKFGVGGTEFRTEQRKMYVDSVAFAVYKRTIFESIGLLDEQLVRNQDDELHYRMNANGYKILMVPEMRSSYFVRNSLSKLFSQYFQYGLYKPLVFAKVKSGIRIRHIVPTFFVLYLTTLPISLYLNLMFITPLILYIVAAIFFSSQSDVKRKDMVCSAFLVLHLSYGAGFLLGLPSFFKYKKHA